ncbi:DUF4179 domain-containing protein [Brevibacillus sp. NPDC003359]|uniref:DUF4179 domain-containing protein n=1 Tax=unclassified Brevibacillus TaxID=2684853 RepID=UPI0036BC2634
MNNEERQIRETLLKVAESVETPSFQMPSKNHAFQVRKRPFYRSKKWTSIGIASAVVVCLLTSIQVSPSFAAYVQSIFDQYGGGLQQAARQGFSETPNLSVTDQGITLTVKEIIADPVQVTAALVIKQSDGKVLDTDLLLGKNSHLNVIELLDEKGEAMSSGWGAFFDERVGFIDFTLGRKEHEPIPKTLSMHVKQIGDTKGSWKLQVPITMTKTAAATTELPVNQTHTTEQGLKLTVHKVINTPTTSRIQLETQWTDPAKKQLEQEVRKLEGKTAAPDYAPYVPYQQYSLGYYYEAADGSKSKRDVEKLELSDSIDRYGHFRWIWDYDPSGKGKPETLVIDSLYRAVPYDMSVTFNPAELSKKPLVKQVGEDTIILKNSRLVKEADTNKQAIELEIEVLSKEITEINPVWWVLQNEQGTTYRWEESNRSSGKPDQLGRKRNTFTLVMHEYRNREVYETTKLPEKLTLRLDVVTKKYPLEWRIPLSH